MSLLFELNRGDLISPAHEQVQRDGQSGHVDTGGTWALAVAALVHAYGATSVLDYGAGQGTLAVALKPLVPPWTRITEYDPAVDRINAVPSFADLVVCTHVLEHIELSRLPMVLAHIRMLTRKAVWVVVSICDTATTQHRMAWWRDTVVAAGFSIQVTPIEAGPRLDTEWMAVLTP